MEKTSDGKYYRKIAKIESTMLGIEDHGIFTAYVFMNYGGSSQGFGGYVLDKLVDRETYRREPMPSALGFVTGVLQAAGVDSWERLKGRTLFVLFANDDEWNEKPIGLEPLPTEPGKRWMASEWAEQVQQAERAGSKP